MISPEGCASILWKTSERASDAAEALGITAHRLKALGLVDKIVSEPVGGAHRDTQARWPPTSSARSTTRCARSPTSRPSELLDQRYERLAATAASPTPRPMPRADAG